MAKTSKNASKINRKQKKVETPITIANYQKLAMRTCLPTCREDTYAYPELMSEISEFSAKHYGFYAKGVRGDFGPNVFGNKRMYNWSGNVNAEGFEKRDKILKEIKEELGDIAWSLALICQLNGYDFSEMLKKANRETKKILKSKADTRYKIQLLIDVGELPPAMMLNVVSRTIVIGEAFSMLTMFCHYYNFKVSDVLRDNIRKLASRQKRGVIMGNGDNR